MTFILPTQEKKMLSKPYCPYPKSMYYHYGPTFPHIKVDPTFVQQCYPRI